MSFFRVLPLWNFDSDELTFPGGVTVDVRLVPAVGVEPSQRNLKVEGSQGFFLTDCIPTLCAGVTNMNGGRFKHLPKLIPRVTEAARQCGAKTIYVLLFAPRLRNSTWGHPQPEVILPSLIPLVFERFLPISTLWLSPNSPP